MVEPPPPRLNPFVFPSDTGFRFLLLIATIVGVTLFAYNWIHINIADTSKEFAALAACADQQSAGNELAVDLPALEAVTAGYRACVARVFRPRADFMLTGVAALALTAGGFYLGTYWWRRRAFAPLEPDEVPGLHEDVAILARESGLAFVPRLRWDALDPRPSALAFGPPGRRTIAITGGLAVDFSSNPPRFRAIVAHELAHFRNRDVDLTFATIAAWLAFLVIAVVPITLTLGSLVAGAPDAVVGLTWRFALLTLLAYLTRNAVLRARELYADVRASTLEPAIRDVLTAMRDAGGLIARLTRLHPPPSERVKAIEQPGRLLRLGAPDAFATGLVGALALEEVTAFLYLYGWNDVSTVWVAALVFAPLVAAVIAMGAWRAVFATLTVSTRLAGSAQLGLALGAGLLVGREIGISKALLTSGPESVTPTGIDVVWIAGALVATAAFARWVATTASLWIPAATRLRSPWPVSVVGFLAAGAMLTAGIAIYTLITSTLPAIGFSGLAISLQHAEIATIVWPGPVELYRIVMDPLTLVVVTEPAVFFLVVAVWAFPLAASVWSRGLSSAPVAAWGGLDADVASPRIFRTATHVRRAIAFGAAGGAVVFVALLLIRIVVKASIPTQIRDTDEFALAFYFWGVCVAILGQSAVAIALAAGGRGRSILHALLAAFVAGLGGALALVGQSPLAACVPAIAFRAPTDANGCGWLPDLSFVIRTFEHVVAFGAAAALVTATVTAAAVLLWRRTRRSVGSDDTAGRRQHTM
jgi:Zn-dependent protease with chaperone function